MLIKLTERAAFWSMVNPLTRELIVHLTFQDPGPKKINYKKLNKHCKYIVDAGLALGNIIKCEEEDAPDLHTQEPEREADIELS